MQHANARTFATACLPACGTHVGYNTCSLKQSYEFYLASSRCSQAVCMTIIGHVTWGHTINLKPKAVQLVSGCDVATCMTQGEVFCRFPKLIFTTVSTKTTLNALWALAGPPQALTYIHRTSNNNQTFAVAHYSVAKFGQCRYVCIKKVNDLRPFVDYGYGPAMGMGTGVASAILSDRLKAKQNGSISSARQFRT